MSLINDALKRVRQMQKKEPSATPPDAPMEPLEPVQTEPSPRRASVFVIPFCLLLVGVGGWFLWQWWSGSPRTAKSVASTPATTNRLVMGAKVMASVRTLSSNRAELISSAEAALSPVPTTNTAAAVLTGKTGVVGEASTRAITSSASDKPAATTNAATSEMETSALAAAGNSRNVNFPALKLQGIYYRLSKPSALINNKTVYLDDEIEGVRVVGIERHSVKIESGGRTKELWLK